MGCANGAWRVFCTFFIVEEWIMRVILDTDKKTITVPWNYAAKLEEINRIIKDGGGAKQYTFRPIWKNLGKPAWMTRTSI